MIVENFLELIDIEDIIDTKKYLNMIDIGVKDDESFLLSNGIISHNSAAGAVKQARDSETEGVYALRGKVKNVKHLSELTENKEIMEIMSILGITPDSDKSATYEKIVIATDEDCIDGEHLIITEEGNKKIKDLTYDDLVLTHIGEYKKIEKIIKTEKKKIIEIEINGNKIACSENHILLIFRDGKITEILAKDLKKTDFMLLKQ